MPEAEREPLTVAIPFYKGHDYLRLAIESVRRQSTPAWRLIVCDDGPEPGTAEVVDSFGDPRMRSLRNEKNLGMAGNWNRCLDAADTDLINLLHDDDELLPNYVELMLRAGRAYPDAAAFFCRAKVIDADGRDTFSFVDSAKSLLVPRSNGALVLRGRDALARLMRGNFIMCPTVCYRKSRIPTDPFRPEWRMVLDLEFFARLLLDGEYLVGLPETAFAYRRHAGNATEAYTATLLRVEGESRLHGQIAAAARDHGWPEVARTASRKWVIKSNLLFRLAQDLSRLRLGAFARKARFLRRLCLGPPGGRARRPGWPGDAPAR